MPEKCVDDDCPEEVSDIRNLFTEYLLLLVILFVLIPVPLGLIWLWTKARQKMLNVTKQPLDIYS